HRFVRSRTPPCRKRTPEVANKSAWHAPRLVDSTTCSAVSFGTTGAFTQSARLVTNRFLVTHHLSLRSTEPCLTEKIIVYLTVFLSASWPQSACSWPGLGPAIWCWRWHDRGSQRLEFEPGLIKGIPVRLCFILCRHLS